MRVGGHLAAMIQGVQVDLVDLDYLGDHHNWFLGLQAALGALDVLEAH